MVERGAGMYRRIRVRPVVDFSNVEEVLVILAAPAAPKPEQSSGQGGAASPKPQAAAGRVEGQP
jgi:hypothetical protein